jgi:hypothetical protein
MLTIVWNPRGFHLIDVFAKCRKFNTTDYLTEILSVISRWLSTEAKGDERKLMIKGLEKVRTASDFGCSTKPEGL